MAKIVLALHLCRLSNDSAILPQFLVINLSMIQLTFESSMNILFVVGGLIVINMYTVMDAWFSQIALSYG